MRNDLSALNMAEEFQPEAFALRRAGDEARHISHSENFIFRFDHTQIRGKGSKRIIGDLGLRCAHSSDKA